MAAPLCLTVVLILIASAPASAQCAMCQGSSGAGNDGGAAYNRSTLFMLCVPYLLLGGVAGYVVYAFRRSRPSGLPSESSSRTQRASEIPHQPEVARD